MKKASYCVSYLSKKYCANKTWLWDVLEERYGMLRGHGWLMTEEEYKDLEQYIKKEIRRT